MDSLKVAEHISRWMGEYCREARCEGFVVGVSGGIDSALCSTLAAMTGKKVLCVTLPIHQAQSQVDRAREHIEWLMGHCSNVKSVSAELTAGYEELLKALPASGDVARQQLTEANTRARLRMTALYYFAGLENMLVVGTGNKIEDFGIGFFTKYGDGGVDISPIADLTKTEVFEVARTLGICPSILLAAPTDGLFGDDRSDEDQIGASYPELEWAMDQVEAGRSPEEFGGREREVMEIYVRRNRANRHKMAPAPVCIIPPELRE